MYQTSQFVSTIMFCALLFDYAMLCDAITLFRMDMSDVSTCICVGLLIF